MLPVAEEYEEDLIVELPLAGLELPVKNWEPAFILPKTASNPPGRLSMLSPGLARVWTIATLRKDYALQVADADVQAFREATLLPARQDRQRRIC